MRYEPSKKRRVVELHRPEPVRQKLEAPSPPIEMAPAVRAMMGYGKRRWVMGVVHGLGELNSFLDSLDGFNGTRDELRGVVAIARSNLQRAKEEALDLLRTEEEDDS